MLGTCVRAKVVTAIGETGKTGYVYPLNFAKIYDTPEDEYAFIYGVSHPVSNFDGRVVGLLRSRTKPTTAPHYWILAPKSQKIINLDIIEALRLDRSYKFKNDELICYYEHSAGAVVYRLDNPEHLPHYLLIQNRRSKHWSFPKGHLEKGETKADAARREVFEETGVHVKLHIGFQGESKYNIGDQCKKKVSLFVGEAQNTDVKLQYVEVKKYRWCDITLALEMLTYDNDKRILQNAHKYLYEIGVLRYDDPRKIAYLKDKDPQEYQRRLKGLQERERKFEAKQKKKRELQQQEEEKKKQLASQSATTDEKDLAKGKEKTPQPTIQKSQPKPHPASKPLTKEELDREIEKLLKGLS